MLLLSDSFLLQHFSALWNTFSHWRIARSILCLTLTHFKMHVYQNKCCHGIHLQSLVNNSLWREGNYMKNHIPKMKSARPVRILLNWLSNEILEIVNWLHPLFLCAVVKCVPVLNRQLYRSTDFREFFFMQAWLCIFLWYLTHTFLPTEELHFAKFSLPAK